VVDEPGTEPVGLSPYSLELEAQALRQTSARIIGHCTLQLHPVKPFYLEEMLYHGACCRRRQSLAASVGYQPVADLGIAVVAIDGPADDAAEQALVGPEAEMKSFTSGELRRELRDEGSGVGRGLNRPGPSQPGIELLTVRGNCSKQRGGIRQLEGTEFSGG